jgi:hypothetical protein
MSGLTILAHYVSMLRRDLKRYGVMITFLDCKAIQIEIAESMELDYFMMAFSRFTNRRGVPLVFSCALFLINVSSLPKFHLL